MTKRPGIFPTFFLSGFECSTFRWKDCGRRDLAGNPDRARCGIGGGGSSASLESSFDLAGRCEAEAAAERISWSLGRVSWPR